MVIRQSKSSSAGTYYYWCMECKDHGATFGDDSLHVTCRNGHTSGIGGPVRAEKLPPGKSPCGTCYGRGVDPATRQLCAFCKGAGLTGR